MSDAVSLRDFFESKFNALNEKLHEVDKKIDSQGVVQHEIKDQTTKTNGRVGVLERNGKIVWAAIALISITLGSVVAVLLSNGIVTPEQIIK
jgi:tetrahydromethanopterin S-methyltransferase subunit G